MQRFSKSVSFIIMVGAMGLGGCGKEAPTEPPIDSVDAGARETGSADAGSGRDAVVMSVPDAKVEASDQPETSTVLPDPPTDAAPPQCGLCGAYGPPVGAGTVPLKLPELSGLAASFRYPDILYAHNDSGDTARFFAISTRAALRAEIDLPGATATDWEDIAVGPCPGGSCVYVGDIGDNNQKRTQYVIYRAPEPDPMPSVGSTITTLFERFPFVYPDGAHNAETLLVHPATGRVFVVTKNAGLSGRVYELPLPLTPNTVATLVAITFVSLPPAAGLVTGGAFHPCAERLLLRTYGGLFEFSRASGGRLEDIFTANYTSIPVATEAQGEAITYSFDGTGYFSSSETVSGSPPAALSGVSCQQ